MKTVRRYVARRVFAATALIFTALVLLFGFFDFIQELTDVGGRYHIALAALYVGLSLPGRAYEILPVAALIGTLFALSQLVVNSEYTVMRVSGVSMNSMAIALARIGITLSVCTFLLGEVVAPLTDQAAQRMRFKATPFNKRRRKITNPMTNPSKIAKIPPKGNTVKKLKPYLSIIVAMV